MMRVDDGMPTVCNGPSIAYLTRADEHNFELFGKLTAGYGSLWGKGPCELGEKIGPEFTFGLTMAAAFEEPVLIIKTAWGGTSLHTDSRALVASWANKKTADVFRHRPLLFFVSLL